MGPYFEVHDGQGPLLLLVHGFLSSRAQWRLNLEALTKIARPVVVEVLGHGRSPAPDDPAAYTVAAYGDAFEAIRRDLGAERWVVCGQSFGAGLTMRYALQHPERVLGQVLTNSNSALSPLDLTDVEQRARLAEEGGLAAIEGMRVHPKHAKRLPKAVRDELIADAALISPRGIAHSLRVTRLHSSVVDDLEKIRVPTLLVNGVMEKKFQPLRDRAVARIPGCQVVDLPGGHPVNIDAAEQFNAAVARFIGTLPRN